MAADDSYTKLLLHFNGSDASTTVTDEAGHTVTATGNAQIDTAQSKFGGASCLFDGTGDYISVTNNDDLYLGSKSFTLDLWYRLNAYPATGNHFALFTHTNGTDLLLLSVFTDGLGAHGYYAYFNGWGAFREASQSLNTWYHVAFVRSGSLFAFYHNGSLLGSKQSLTSGLPQISANLTISYRNAGSPDYFNGWIDEYRLSVGIARYEGNFVPESKEYAKDFNGLYAIPYKTSMIRNNPIEMIGIADRQRIGTIGTTKYNYIGA